MVKQFSSAFTAHKPVTTLGGDLYCAGVQKASKCRKGIEASYQQEDCLCKTACSDRPVLWIMLKVCILLAWCQVLSPPALALRLSVCGTVCETVMCVENIYLSYSVQLFSFLSLSPPPPPPPPPTFRLMCQYIF